MPKENTLTPRRQVKMRHIGRLGQMRIYFGKLLRMFLYQGDWKVLPMSALIAGLVGIVIAGRFHRYMEGTLTSSLAIMCACLWNGCFNSVQVICRERGVIKREHRSGLHISAYILAHMQYQALLCLAQTGISLYVFRFIGIDYPARGAILPSFAAEFFISMFLITYAADMMSLWLSSLARSTTAAMTIMPVLLIIQLVFSGGMMTLPEALEPVKSFTISSWGLNLITAEADYNNQELATPWNTLWGMRGTQLDATVTVGQVLDFLEESDMETVRELRETELSDGSTPLGALTVGDLVEMARTSENAEELRAQPIHVKTSVGELMNIVGANKIRSYVLETTSKAAFKEEYVFSARNITHYWLMLILFSAVFASLATVTLEFIDRDKR